MTERATLLVELVTEELPPKSLRALSEAFAERVLAALAKSGLAQMDAPLVVYATPRRLAFTIAGVAASAPGRESEVTGPSASAPQQAIAGFARKHGVAVADLGRRDTPKGAVLIARVKAKGAVLDELLAGYVDEALKTLPIPKLMRWGAGEAQFVRPVHGLVMLHGERIVPGAVLGLPSGRTTAGHRFLGERSIALPGAEDYEARLQAEGKVIASFAARRAEIDRQLKSAALVEKASLGGYADLLDEVTALVELPQVYAGGFDAAFLEVPAECLILTMRQNQKYFPLFDGTGKLVPRFLIVSNMLAADPRHIIAGNERVVRPRLQDARFFYNQDRKHRLDARVPQLAKLLYSAKLGSMLARVERLRMLAARIAERLRADVALAERAAYLCKADRVTGMVGEFPELQGVMGRYYALHDGESVIVADAIAEHYLPNFAGDRLPEHAVARRSRLQISSNPLPVSSVLARRPPASATRLGCAARRSGLFASSSSARCRCRSKSCWRPPLRRSRSPGRARTRNCRRSSTSACAATSASAATRRTRSRRCWRSLRRGSISSRGSWKRCGHSPRCPKRRASPRPTSASATD